MGNIPYVSEYQLFVRTDFKLAEEILADYNDFYIFNMAQCGDIYYKTDENVNFDGDEEADDEKLAQVAERNAKAATEHFASLFGNKDFSESSMVGFRPSWYDLQKILLEEYKRKTPIQDSAMNGIAPTLREVASIMLFACRVIEDLEKLGAEQEHISVIKEGFQLLIERIVVEDIPIPVYYKTKAVISKFKKAEQYIDFCDKLFSGAL